MLAECLAMAWCSLLPRHPASRLCLQTLGPSELPLRLLEQTSARHKVRAPSLSTEPRQRPQVGTLRASSCPCPPARQPVTWLSLKAGCQVTGSTSQLPPRLPTSPSCSTEISMGLRRLPSLWLSPITLRPATSLQLVSVADFRARKSSRSAIPVGILTTRPSSSVST